MENIGKKTFLSFQCNSKTYCNIKNGNITPFNKKRVFEIRINGQHRNRI